MPPSLLESLQLSRRWSGLSSVAIRLVSWGVSRASFGWPSCVGRKVERNGIMLTSLRSSLKRYLYWSGSCKIGANNGVMHSGGEVSSVTSGITWTLRRDEAPGSTASGDDVHVAFTGNSVPISMLAASWSFAGSDCVPLELFVVVSSWESAGWELRSWSSMCDLFEA
jgi:hypothetical protein